MPTFTISVVDETFSASEEYEGPSADAAVTQAIKAALQIGAEEVVSGKPFFVAEVKVANGGETVTRYVVSIGASPLQTPQ